MTNGITNILIVGVGGQGTILAGKALARAAVLSGQDVKFSEVHGMAQRGGSVVTQVRFGKQVYSPIVESGTADFMLAFEQLEGLRWAHMLKPGGTMIVSTQVIEPMPVLTGAATYPEEIFTRLKHHGNIIAMEALDLAIKAGNARTSNVVLLGCLARAMNLKREVWDLAMQDTIPPMHFEVNKKAFQLGWEQKGKGD